MHRRSDRSALYLRILVVGLVAAFGCTSVRKVTPPPQAPPGEKYEASQCLQTCQRIGKSKKRYACARKCPHVVKSSGACTVEERNDHCIERSVNELGQFIGGLILLTLAVGGIWGSIERSRNR